MLNRVTVMGRLVKDPDLRYTQTNIPVASFTIACERSQKGKNKEAVTDFINCVAWRHNAEFVSKNFSKGKTIVVDGSIQQRKFTTKDGENRNVHEVVADNVFFGSASKSTNQSQTVDVYSSVNTEADYEPTDVPDGQLPF